MAGVVRARYGSGTLYELLSAAIVVLFFGATMMIHSAQFIKGPVQTVSDRDRLLLRVSASCSSALP